MSLIDIGCDLSFQWSGQLQVEHCCIRQVKFLSKLDRLPIKFLGVTGHVTDNNGVKDRA